MKLVILILNFVFLCSTLSTAQKTISKEDFEFLVDYANCKYVKSFIEKNDLGKPYFKDYYEKKVKPELEKATLDSFKTILAYEKLIELLYNNAPAQQLAKKINERKLKFDEFQDNESLIKSLVTISWINIDFSKTAANIQDEILTKYNLDKDKKDNSISESEVAKTQTIQTSRQVDELQLKINQLLQQYENLKNDTKVIEHQNSFKNLRSIVIYVLGLFFLIIVAVYLLLNKGISREYIIKQVLGSERIAEKFTQKDYTKPYNLTEKDLNTIVDRVLESKLLNGKKIQPQLSPTVKESSELSISATKYLKGKSGKIFNRVENTPENSFFKLLNEKNDIALFEFSGDEAEAIAKRIFSEDICNIVSGSYQNANSVKTNKPGKIKRVGDQWEVIEQVEIKLI